MVLVTSASPSVGGDPVTNPYREDGRCAKCKRPHTPVERYMRYGQMGNPYYRWLCRACAITEGLVTPTGFGG